MAFKICSKGTCGITVTDLNEDNYQTSSVLTATGSIYYTFKQSASVNILTSLSYSGDKDIKSYEITTHSVSVNDSTEEETYVTDESSFDFPSDGLYEVTHIILPTLEYINTYYSQLSTYFTNGIYFTDNSKLYKYTGYTADDTVTLNYEEITIEELYEINTTKTTIIKESKSTFSLCQLKDCFYKYVKKLLKALCGLGECDAQSKYAQDILNRDLIWMAINAIRYAIEQGQYLEAQRLLESIQGCGNICSSINKSTNGGLGCGCNN